jgi:hypothetical protein
MSHNPIIAIADRAKQLRETGVDVITLAAGEPDAPTCAHIVDAAIRAAADPANHHYGSATGLRSLRDAIARRLVASSTLPWSADDVLVTLGAKHALALAFNAILSRPQDTVLVPSPGWPGHRAAVQAARGRAQQVDTTPNRGYVVTAADLEAAWVPGTRAVVLANPANPTGAALSDEHWTAIADWAARRDVWVISDDVYSELVYDRQQVPVLRAAPELRERCVLVDSVSKTHAMTRLAGRLAGSPADRGRLRHPHAVRHDHPRAADRSSRRPRGAHQQRRRAAGRQGRLPRASRSGPRRPVSAPRRRLPAARWRHVPLPRHHRAARRHPPRSARPRIWPRGCSTRRASRSSRRSVRCARSSAPVLRGRQRPSRPGARAPDRRPPDRRRERRRAMITDPNPPTSELVTEQLALSVDDVELTIAAARRSRQDAPVVFLHGFGSTKEDYIDFVHHPAFADRPFLAYDAPGCGETSAVICPSSRSRSSGKPPEPYSARSASSASTSSATRWAD